MLKIREILVVYPIGMLHLHDHANMDTTHGEVEKFLKIYITRVSNTHVEHVSDMT